MVILAKFSHPLVFSAPAEGFLLKFCNGGVGARKKQNDIRTKKSKKFDDNSLRHNTGIGPTDKQNW